MAYTFWSVVFGEQPSASKWNILGTNDAGFRDGTNFALNNNVIPANALATNAITLGYAEVTTGQNFTGTIVDATGLSITVTVPAGGRRVKVTFYCSGFLSSVNNDIATFSIYEGATELQNSTNTHNGIAGSTMGNVVVEWIGTPSAGSHTYKVRFQRVVGTGSFLAGAGSSRPMFILAEVI